MKYQPIVNYAAKLIRKYRTRDPFELAQAMHISVLIQDTFKRQKGAFKLVMNVPFIFINGNLSKTAQTLICAHELGHALLHRRLGALMEFELCDMTTLCELEANIFAAELLLDEREIEENPRARSAKLRVCEKI